jgi:hypothetical protein
MASSQGNERIASAIKERIDAQNERPTFLLCKGIECGFEIGLRSGVLTRPIRESAVFWLD